jgi:hypothetical protein
VSQEEFLRECGKSYPEAMSALAYFRQAIQQQCKAVVQQRIDGFAEILGVSPWNLKLTEYAEPDNPKLTAWDETNLGWQAKRSDDLYLYFYLCWTRQPDKDVAPLSVRISIWIKDREKREGLAALLDRHSDDPAFKDQPWYVDERHFWMSIQEHEIPRVADKLDALCDYTIRFLKPLEGIENYFRP